MTQHITIIVSGSVQGVSYRMATKAKAFELGVKGFVRNEENGNVYIEAEASQDVLNEFVKWCAIGPPRASVQHVDVTHEEVKPFINFIIVK
jgi:acylphosphatase